MFIKMFLKYIFNIVLYSKNILVDKLKKFLYSDNKNLQKTLHVNNCVCYKYN